MANQEQGMRRGRFSTRLIQREVDEGLFLIPFIAVAAAGVFEFEGGRMFFMDAVDSLGKAWLFLCRFRTTGDMRNYLTIYSPEFVTEKGLKANDLLIFIERPQEEGERPCREFRVEIKREIKLFGKNVWGDVVV